MGTEETRLESGNVVPLNRHTSSEPARLTAPQETDAAEVEVQENRHTSSEPAD